MIDIGANVGYFGVIAGTVVDRDRGGSIHLIEANPRLAELVFKTLNVTGLVGMATITAAAVSDRPGTLRLHLPQHLWGSAYLGHADDTFRDSIESTTGRPMALDAEIVVPAITLDDFTAERGITRVDLVKIDIEGHEQAAYAGMQRVIEENRDHLQILLEFSGGQYEDPTGFFERITTDFKFTYVIDERRGQLVEVGSYRDILPLSAPGFAMVLATNRERPGS